MVFFDMLMYFFQDRYEAFMRMAREWRHIQMLKRAGRGHDPAGVNATQEGECAVLCPACPQPGKNLPEDWQQAPRTKGYLIFSPIILGASNVVVQMVICPICCH
jgi:hypothetical protein